MNGTNIAIVIFSCTFGTDFEKLKLTIEKIKINNNLTLKEHMNKNLKLAIMLVGASILCSTVTMMATSELQKKGVITDTYVLNKESTATDDGFVKTASRPVDFSRDFTDVAESTINCVVSIKSYATPQQNMYQGDFFDPFEFFFGYGKGYRLAHYEENKIADLQCLPDSLQGTEYYVPTSEGVEARIKTRLEQIKAWKAELKRKRRGT